jgi:predicted dehydrogenase
MSKQHPPLDVVHIAIIGCGGMAQAHAGWLKEIPEAKVVALCDIKPEKTEAMWRNRFGADPKIKRYNSTEALFKRPPKELDAVIIVTPHTLHFEQSMAALDAGYHVLVEKPMVTRSDHAKKLAAKVKETGLLLQVSFQASYSAEFAYIRDVLAKGGLGELQTVTAWSHQNWLNACANSWRHDPKLSGGGQMYDTGAHLFNAIAWCLDRPVEEVFCWLDKKTVPVDINAVMTIRWEGGVLGTATISGNNPGWDQGVIIAGDKGRIHTGIHGGLLEHFDARGNKIKYPAVPFAHQSPDRNFVDCLLGRAEPMCPVRYGILHSWLMDALYKSAKAGAPVKLTKPPLPMEKPKPTTGFSASTLRDLITAENAANPC